MYNLGMKNILENKVNIWEKYKYNTILSLIIFILFLIAGYSKQNIEYKVYDNNIKAELVHGIHTVNNDQYIHIEDLTKIFSDNIYEDKISGKVIITTHDTLKKIKKSDENYVVKKDGDTYFDLVKIIKEIDKNIFIAKDNIYITDAKIIETITNNNRVEVYNNKTGDVLDFVNKGEKIKILLDDKLKDESCKILSVVTEDNNYGYALKENFEYEYEVVDELKDIKKQVLVKVEDKISSNTDIEYVDLIAINMYRLSGESTLVKLDYTNDIKDNTKVFATINNGYKSSNYDQDIVTGMLNSDTNRYLVIDAIQKSVKDIAGVNVDFANIKTTDKDKFTQFVRELAAVLHSHNKKVIVNVPTTQYIDVQAINKVVDYIVVQPYSARTLASKTSGPISSITYVENGIKEIINSGVDSTKVILEVPTYTILWTERGGTVINAEQYNMKTMKEYMTTNNIKSYKDSISGQNVINYTKGIITYKMWLEDEYSIIEKTKLASKYNLGGISVYRSGMEEKSIYKKIDMNLK